MGLKILHSADWHLDAPFTRFSEEDRQYLREQLRQIPGAVAELCRREGCDLVLLAGDLFDGSPSRQTVDLVKEALAECAVPVCIAPGNHDYIRPGSPYLQERWPENVRIFTGPLESLVLPELSCRVWGCGYRAMDCPPQLEHFRAEGEERYKLAVLHGDPANSDSPYCPVSAEQVKHSGLQYLALGHIHKPGSFRAGNTLCAWPGCAMGRGWDETGEKYAFIAEIGEETVLRRFPLPGPRFREETVDIAADALAALEQILPPGESGDLFRVTLTGSGEADLPALTAAFPGVRLWLRDRTEPPVDIWAAAGEDTLEGVYFRMLREAAEAARPGDREQVLLAAAISRKLLDGREVELP